MIPFFKYTGRHKTAVPIIILIAVALLAMGALFHPGLFTSHDGWHQVVRLYHFDQAIRDGQIVPRWSGGLLKGFGYPLFIFSYHLPWFIAEPMVLSGMSIFDSIKAVFVLTYLVSGVVMFLWVREMWGETAGFMSATVYLITPYRFATILVRANIGEAVSFSVIPLIFWGITRLAKKPTIGNAILGAVGIGGFILSHVMVGFLFLLPILGWLVVNFISALDKKRYPLGIAGMGLVGLGISAYYLLPAIYYKPSTVFANIYHDLYKNHFTSIVKLIYSPWGYGAIGTNGEMSRQVGLGIWLIVILSIGVSIIIIKRRIQKMNSNLELALVFLASFVWGLIMMQRISAGIWKAIEPLTLVDFPWRFLAVTTFCGAVLAGWLTFATKNKKLRMGLIISLMIILLYTNRNHVRVNQYTDIPLSLYLSSELTTNTDDEYLPKWVDRQHAHGDFPVVENQAVSVSQIKQNSRNTSFAYAAETDVQTVLHQMYFPGVEADIDGKTEDLAKSDRGELALMLPHGEHTVHVAYMSTAIMRVGEAVTLLTLAFILVSGAHTLYRKYRHL